MPTASPNKRSAPNDKESNPSCELGLTAAWMKIPLRFCKAAEQISCAGSAVFKKTDRAEIIQNFATHNDRICTYPSIIIFEEH